MGQSIVKRAEALEDADWISIREEQLPSGSFKFLYEAIVDVPPAIPRMAERIVQDVVEQYGRVDWQTAVAAAKSTPPYKETPL